MKKIFRIPLVFATVLIGLTQIFCPIFPVNALTPLEPHDANAMWIEPSIVELDPGVISVGHKFNVTVWANASKETKGWQFWLLYGSQYINATRAGYTAGDKSEFFKDIIAMPIIPSFKVHNATHNRLDYGEAWLMGPYREPGYGSLCWIEFEVIALPPGGVLAEISLDFKWAYDLFDPPKTYLLYSDDTYEPLEVCNGMVRFLGTTPDYSPPAINILLPQNKTYITTSIQLTFTVNETTSWIGYSLDGAANVTITGNTTLLSISYGYHNIIVYATDNAGNTGASETVYFTIVQPTTKPTDLTHDGYTGIDDILEAEKYFGSYPGHPRWNSEADIDNDEYISIQDIVLIANDFGTMWP